MENTKPFYDFCISEKCVSNQNFPELLKKLKKYGYKTIAINKYLTEEHLSLKKSGKNKKGVPRETEIVPNPISLPNLTLTENENIKIFQRLTIQFSDREIFQKVITSPNFKKFDIFAVIPMNQKCFQYICLESDIVDLVTFNPEFRIPFKIHQKNYMSALNKNIFFELMYWPAISDSTLRKNIINTGHLYHYFRKSKNIILSSWAINQTMIRGPYDLVNLGLVFGLSEEQSKNAISINCKNLLQRAESRKIGKALMLVKTIENVSTLVIDDSIDSDMESEIVEKPLKKSKPSIIEIA